MYWIESIIGGKPIAISDSYFSAFIIQHSFYTEQNINTYIIKYE